MDFEQSKVYIQTDDHDRILRCEGGYTTPADLTGWIEIDEGTGDKYNLCQSHYFEGGLYTHDGIPRYRWDGSQALLRTEEEIEADREALLIPTAGEQIAVLKAELDATDYKIIKCSEYQLAGLEMPYDMAALHAERQEIRDQINALEAGQEVSVNE